MSDEIERIDPTDIHGINERTRAWANDPQAVVPLDIKHIVIDDHGIEALADLVRSLGSGGKTMMVVDHTAMSRAGDDLKTLVEAALGRVVPIVVYRLPKKSGGEFHADVETAHRLAGELRDFSAIVSVGSGSITDVAKYARHLAVEKTPRSLPFICFPSAASVTAYTSAIAVLIHDGCKRNFLSGLPEAVVCDLPTLACAPPLMTRAGFADVLARSVAYGDWFLAKQLGLDSTFSALPNKLLAPAEQVMIDHAEQIAEGRPIGIRAVVEALLLAGVCMSVINDTAPISGWEHVISHYLDMTAGRDGREMALHGGQVGVGTLISARAYDRCWANLDLDRITADLSEADIAGQRSSIAEIFGACDSTGAMAAEVRREFDQKIIRWQQGRKDRKRLAKRKRSGQLDNYLKSIIRTSGQISDALARARAPQRFAELDKPIPRPAALEAVRFGHFVRARFTLGDLLAHSGWLNETSAESLIDEPVRSPGAPAFQNPES